MAPSVSNSKKVNNNKLKFKKILKKKVLEYQKFIQENCKYVGENFAQEARSIQYDNKKICFLYSVFV